MERLVVLLALACVLANAAPDSSPYERLLDESNWMDDSVRRAMMGTDTAVATPVTALHAAPASQSVSPTPMRFQQMGAGASVVAKTQTSAAATAPSSDNVATQASAGATSTGAGGHAAPIHVVNNINVKAPMRLRTDLRAASEPAPLPVDPEPPIHILRALEVLKPVPITATPVAPLKKQATPAPETHPEAAAPKPDAPKPKKANPAKPSPKPKAKKPKVPGARPEPKRPTPKAPAKKVAKKTPAKRKKKSVKKKAVKKAVKKAAPQAPKKKKAAPKEPKVLPKPKPSAVSKVFPPGRVVKVNNKELRVPTIVAAPAKPAAGKVFPVIDSSIEFSQAIPLGCIVITAANPGCSSYPKAPALVERSETEKTSVEFEETAEGTPKGLYGQRQCCEKPSCPGPCAARVVAVAAAGCCGQPSCSDPCDNTVLAVEDVPGPGQLDFSKTNQPNRTNTTNATKSDFRKAKRRVKRLTKKAVQQKAKAIKKESKCEDKAIRKCASSGKVHVRRCLNKERDRCKRKEQKALKKINKKIAKAKMETRKVAAAVFGPPGPKTLKRRLGKKTKSLKKAETDVLAKTTADNQRIAALKKKQQKVKRRMKGLRAQLAGVVKKVTAPDDAFDRKFKKVLNRASKKRKRVNAKKVFKKDPVKAVMNLKKKNMTRLAKQLAPLTKNLATAPVKSAKDICASLTAVAAKIKSKQAKHEARDGKLRNCDIKIDDQIAKLRKNLEDRCGDLKAKRPAAQYREVETRIQRISRKIRQLKRSCKRKETKSPALPTAVVSKQAKSRRNKRARSLNRVAKRARKDRRKAKKRDSKFNRWVVKRLADIAEGVQELDLAMLAMVGRNQNRTSA